MNRTIRNLFIAVPLATVGLTMVNTAAATAGPNDPNFPIAIPEKPKGPQDKAPVPPKPKPPQDKAPLPKPKPKDKAPKPAPKPQGGNQVVAPSAAAAPKVEKKAVKVVETVSAHGSADSIDRADYLYVAGPAETELVADTTNDGMDLTWLLVGGGIVTASGIAFAARKRSTSSN